MTKTTSVPYKRLKLLLLFVLPLILLTLVGCFTMQNALLYHPETAPLSVLEGQASRLGLKPWPSAKEHVGWRGEEVANPKGVVVVFHGNAGEATSRVFYVRALSQRGFNVILAEYPGFGAREGDLGEASLVADGIRTVAMVHKAYPELPLFVMGESLGAGVTAAVVGQSKTPIAGAALLTPWDTLKNTAKEHFPGVLVWMMLRDRYDSVKHLQNFVGPVAVVVAERDTIIPPARGKALYEQILEPKKHWLLPGAGHNNWPSHPGSFVWDEIVGFWLAPR